MNNPTGFITALLQLAISEIPLIISLIFGGCCSNVFSLEMLVGEAPKSGQLITLGQFGFVAIEGLLQHVTWGKRGPKLKPRVVPISNWFLLVTMFFMVSVLNNLALGYNISIPLHIIFRSGGLIINMLLGILILKKRYSIGQITGILLVTVGVIYATLDNYNISDHSQHNNSSNTSSSNNINSTSDKKDVSAGIILLVIAMFLSAAMGLFQEVLYRKYGKQWREGLFYTHFLALPLFLVFYKDLFHQVVLYNKSPLQPLSVIFEQIPILNVFRENIPFIGLFKMRKLWAFLIMNVITQYVCIAGVNRMTSLSTSLTLNLVLNLRKFISLMISVAYFNSDFGAGVKIGSTFVFFGTFIYTLAGLL